MRVHVCVCVCVCVVRYAERLMEWSGRSVCTGALYEPETLGLLGQNDFLFDCLLLSLLVTFPC